MQLFNKISILIFIFSCKNNSNVVTNKTEAPMTIVSMPKPINYKEIFKKLEKSSYRGENNTFVYNILVDTFGKVIKLKPVKNYNFQTNENIEKIIKELQFEISYYKGKKIESETTIPFFLKYK